MIDLREEMLNTLKMHAEAHIEKHRMNVEIYLTNPVGVGEHSEVMDEIEKQLELPTWPPCSLFIIRPVFTVA